MKTFYLELLQHFKFEVGHKNVSKYLSLDTLRWTHLLKRILNSFNVIMVRDIVTKRQHLPNSLLQSGPQSMMVLSSENCFLIVRRGFRELFVSKVSGWYKADRAKVSRCTQAASLPSFAFSCSFQI